MGTANSPLRPKLDQQCDRCVKCGMCLTVCPTYRLARQETESPRGRITMIQALARQELALTPHLISHLDNCLQCRACEAICPSGVPYGDIIEQGQTLLRAKKSRNLTMKTFWHLFNRLLQQRTHIITLPRLLWILRISGLPRLMKRSGIAVSASLAKTSHRLPAARTAAKADTGIRIQPVAERKVTLFPGCMGQLLQREVMTDAIRLLEHCGFNVELSAPGQCCGALHAREGEQVRARELLGSSINSFPPDRTTVSLVSACTARLDSAPDKSTVIEDFATFLSHHWPDDIKLRPLPKTILVHEACSLRNVLKQQKHLYRILQAIPAARVEALPDNAICCGAAGTHTLSHPAQAASFLQPKLDQILALQADIVVTTNLGCALHFQTGLGNKRSIEVMHPASLLASLL